MSTNRTPDVTSTRGGRLMTPWIPAYAGMTIF